MTKIIYSLCFAAAAIGFTSCSGQEEYDAYVADLKEQPAAIDTISSPASYAVYLDALAVKADNFGQLGLKLNDSQKSELEALSADIQKALTDKYNALAATPVALPDSIPVLEASAPVGAINETGSTPELQ